MYKRQRLDSFTQKRRNLILWYWTVGVDIRGEGITSENTAKETPANRDYDTVILPEEGYRLPEEIEVTVGGGTLGPGDYVWNPGTGEVHIGGEHVTDDIVIRADADKLYEITAVSYTHLGCGRRRAEQYHKAGLRFSDSDASASAERGISFFRMVQ